jgi:type VI secretion system secreted protein Hcp
MKVKHLFPALALSALFCVSAMTARAQGVTRFYVTIDGVKQGRFKGETRDNRILGVGFAYQVTSPRDMATGQASGKRQHSPIVITKEWGATSPQLFEAATRNEVLRTVLIEFVETSRTGAEEVYQTIKLTNATVSGIRMHLNEPRPGEPPDNRALEDVSFTFQRIEFENKPAKTAAMDDWTR